MGFIVRETKTPDPLFLPWRVAFAFDARRHAILLVAGDKSGGSEKRFYDELIRKADKRFDAHLASLKKERK